MFYFEVHKHINYFLSLRESMQHKICPWVKQGVVKSRPVTFSVCLCGLFIVIAKQSFIGNWTRLNSNGQSFVIIGILGIKTTSPWDEPERIVASIMFRCILISNKLLLLI